MTSARTFVLAIWVACLAASSPFLVALRYCGEDGFAGDVMLMMQSLTVVLQEIVIIRGKKYHPEDIEGAAYSADTAQNMFRPGCMVACAYEIETGMPLAPFVN